MFKNIFGLGKKKEAVKINEEKVSEEVAEKELEVAEEEVDARVEELSEELEDIEVPITEVATKVTFKERLVNPRKGFFTKLKQLFVGKPINDELYDELEELLIQSDLGFDMTLKTIEELEKRVSKAKAKTSEDVYSELKEILKEKLIKENNKLVIEQGKLNVILVVGVNGVGKTTSIGKIASKLKNEGKKVIVGAGDTFRAAAIEQLEEWGKRTGVEVIKQFHGSDPAAVVFDAVSVAKNKGYDVVIIDTAGRLHNKTDLMKELEKINRIIIQQTGEENFERLLVIDSTTGQNGLQQAKLFNELVDLTGIVLTKFDGTAKGGIIFPISEELQKPIKFIGVGEGIDDLKEFNSKEFVDAIFD